MTATYVVTKVKILREALQVYFCTNGFLTSITIVDAGCSGADPEILQGGWQERVCVHSTREFLTAPTFVGLAHAHFIARLRVLGC